jgi:hypothetical protein
MYTVEADATSPRRRQVEGRARQASPRGRLTGVTGVITSRPFGNRETLMPFPPQEPRPYTRENVEQLRPNQIGCYGIFRDDLCVYIGAGDLRSRLLAHLDGENACVSLHRPTHWLNVLADRPGPVEAELVRELLPICNARVA